MTIVLSILMVISAIVLIITVLLQSSDSDGVSALAGGSSESFFGKNQTSTLEGKLAMATKVSAAVFVILAVIMLAI